MCSILIIRLICPLGVSHTLSCKALSVLRFDNFCKSRSKSFFTLSATLLSLIDSAVFFFVAGPPFFADFFLVSAAAAAVVSSSCFMTERRFFSSSHFFAGSKMEPSGGAISRKIKGIEDLCLIVTKALRVSLSNVLAIPSRYINAYLSTQYTSKVRSLKSKSGSFWSGSGTAAMVAAAPLTLLLLLFDAFACVGFGTKDMHDHNLKAFVCCLNALRKGKG
mmetsp:Transcript_6762/g.8764  ORF Transcript_6762/g.8764 Transcript_6762/m.8764 type:complete len:220 (+) Transcript_6762:3488-4147(+)